MEKKQNHIIPIIPLHGWGVRRTRWGVRKTGRGSNRQVGGGHKKGGTKKQGGGVKKRGAHSEILRELRSVPGSWRKPQQEAAVSPYCCQLRRSVRPSTGRCSRSAFLVGAGTSQNMAVFHAWKNNISVIFSLKGSIEHKGKTLPVEIAVLFFIDYIWYYLWFCCDISDLLLGCGYRR